MRRFRLNRGNVGQARIGGQEGVAMCFVGLAGNHLLWVAYLQLNSYFGPVLRENSLRTPTDSAKMNEIGL